MSFQFAWPWLFACLPLPWLAWRFLKPAPKSGSGAIRVPFFEQVATFSRAAGRTPRPTALLLAVCWVLLVSAAARPQWLGEIDRIPSSGRNLMLAVDISGSMNTKDLTLSGAEADRLAVVKNLGAEFLSRRVGDRVGLVLFGTNAYLQAPLTLDRETVAALLEEAVIGIAGERTAIGDAIGLAIKRLREVEADQRVMVLMTDGANTAGSVSPSEAAQLAATADLRIYTIGIGAERMRVNSLFGVRDITPSADLDEGLLREIADETGGRYFRADSTDALEQIYEIIDDIEPVPQAGLVARRIEELFYWPLSLILAVMIAWMAHAAWTNRASWRYASSLGRGD